MKQSAAFFSIGFKLTGIVSLLLGLSLGGLTLLSTWFYSSDIERTLKTSTMERVELLSSSVETDLQNMTKSARLVAATMEGGLVLSGTGAGATDMLLSQTPELRAVHIVGREPGGSLAILATADASESAEYGPGAGASGQAIISALSARLERAFAGDTVVLNVSPECGVPTLAIAFPVSFLAENRADRIALASVSMEPVLAALASREFYTNYVVDAEGVLLMHPDRELVLARPSFAANELVHDSMTGLSELKQMETKADDGSLTIGSYRRFFADSLAMVSTVNRDTALAGVYRLEYRNLMISVMILCFSILMLFLFSKSLTTPIKRLVDGATRIRGGDFTVRIPPTTRDEIGRLSGTFNSMAEGLAERDKIKSAFGKFVNKEIAERVMKGEVQLGGESRTAAISFTDIRSFTAISERLSPHAVVEFLNEYLTRMVECVNVTNGVVDKFIGDAIMAIWGVPDSRGNDTENAINGALLMRKALSEFNRGRGSADKPVIMIGTGINTGEVIAGQIGSLERMEYTCIGDPVNLASRIESLNKLFHTDILISEHSFELVKRTFRVEPMKQILVKGKAAPQQIYAVLGRYDDPDSFRSIADLRAFLGYDEVRLEAVNPDAEEKKYEVAQ